MRWVLFVSLLSHVACGGEEPAATTPESPASPFGGRVEEGPHAAETPEPEAIEGYAIHEWGLIHFGLGEDHALATAGPGRYPVAAEGTIGVGSVNTVGLKPVLYAHLLGGADEARFSARVHVPRGTLPEHWPDAQLTTDDSGVTAIWPDVVARGGSCTGSSYPTIGSARCSLPDNLCEAAELAAYETSDGACLQVDGARFDHLFYRAGMPTGGPLAITLEGNTANVTHRGTNPIPGRLMRVLREHEGVTYVRFVDPPAPGETVRVEWPSDAGTSTIMPAVDAHMRQLGMTEAEREAFARAWRYDLVGGDAPSSRVLQRQPRGPIAPAPDALYYWLGPEDAAALLPLHFEPEPVVLRRALLARVHLNRVAARPGIRIRIGDVAVQGGELSGAVMRRFIRRRLAQVRDCFERSGSEQLSVEFTMHGEVGAEGTTERVTLSGESVAPYRACLVTAMESWTYPPPSGGQMSLDVPFLVSGFHVPARSER